MGSGRGDRNQVASPQADAPRVRWLQWGPVVVTGIRPVSTCMARGRDVSLQWGPVVVTGISGEDGFHLPGAVASMGSGRGDRNQDSVFHRHRERARHASMGSGRGDRNQSKSRKENTHDDRWLQWGPVVVTGIRGLCAAKGRLVPALQWGPVVVTGISSIRPVRAQRTARFNGVRSW